MKRLLLALSMTSLGLLFIAFSLRAQPLVDPPLAVPILHEGFEDGLPPEWARYVREPSVGGWEIISPTTAYSGTAAIFHDDRFTDQVSWLVTPRVTPTIGSRLTFWQFENYETFFENHSIWVSVGQRHPKEGDYVLLKSLEPGLEDSWQQITIDLDKYIGQDIYIAFQYESDLGDEWVLDEIIVSADLVASNDGATVLGETTTLSATIDSTSSVISYTWAFGDGMTGTGETVDHTYATIGAYTATVTATNSTNSTTAQTVVLVQEEITDLEIVGNPWLTPTQETSLSAETATGSDIVYEWENMEATQTVTRSYAALDVYTVTVSAENLVSALTATVNITVEFPVEGLTMTTDAPTILHEPTNFDVSITSGSNVNYSIDYGDGAVQRGGIGFRTLMRRDISYKHTFASVGSYTVTMTATNLTGDYVISQTVDVDVPFRFDVFKESFEDGLPQSWRVVTGELDGVGWKLNDDQSHTGDYSYYHRDAFGKQDSWLITERFTVPYNSRLFFWQYQNYDFLAKSHEVYISTGSADPKVGDFVLLKEMPAGAEETWEEIELDLTDLAGEQIVIGFRYQGNNDDEWWLDDIRVYAEPTLTVTNPTVWKHATEFMIKVPSGSRLQYEWSYGDSQIGSGYPISHTYGYPGDYVASVELSNSLDSMVMTTTVEVRATVYLPMVTLDACVGGEQVCGVKKAP